MKRQIFRYAFRILLRAFCPALLLTAATLSVVAQRRAVPVIVRRVQPQTVRDSRLETAIVNALYEGDEASAARDEVRYYYNLVDLNGDGRPEAIVYVFGTTWCGSAGCAALVFRAIEGGYELVTHISGVENPVIVSRLKTRGWNDLIAHVRWGEVDEHTLRDYYAVLRFDGRTYPDQFPGAPPLDARAKVRGTAYLTGNQSPASGLRLRVK
jgi:hypothetical protein